MLGPQLFLKCPLEAVTSSRGMNACRLVGACFPGGAVETKRHIFHQQQGRPRLCWRILQGYIACIDSTEVDESFDRYRVNVVCGSLSGVSVISLLLSFRWCIPLSLLFFERELGGKVGIFCSPWQNVESFLFYAHTLISSLNDRRRDIVVRVLYSDTYLYTVPGRYLRGHQNVI